MAKLHTEGRPSGSGFTADSGSYVFCICCKRLNLSVQFCEGDAGEGSGSLKTLLWNAFSSLFPRQFM